MLKKSILKKKTILHSNSTLKKGSCLISKSSLNKNKSLLKSNTKLEKTTEIKKQSEKSKRLWEEIREKALSRDKHKCIVCGNKATQVHHIHLRSERKDLIYNLNNLVSLCSKHHFHQGAYRYNEQTELIARVKHMDIDKLLKFAEMNDE